MVAAYIQILKQNQRKKKVESNLCSCPVLKTGRIRLDVPAQEAPAKIDPALELEVLLYQITSSQKLQYSNTVSDLVKTGEKVKKSLDQIMAVCGLPVMEIVETCFETCPQDEKMMGAPNGQDPAFVVIEEVASALVRQAEQFRKQEQA